MKNELQSPYDPDVQRRDAAAFTLNAMLQPQNIAGVNDPASLSTIRAGLTVIANSLDSAHNYMET